MANTELRIKELCKEKGLTIAQLAEKLGILPASFSQALGRNMFSIEKLANIADVLEVEIPDLFKSGQNTIICPKCGTRFRMEE